MSGRPFAKFDTEDVAVVATRAAELQSAPRRGTWMRHCFPPVLALVGLPSFLAAQRGTSIPFQLSSGYDWLSNSFNGVPGSRHPLDGWDFAMGFPSWRNLRFKIDFSDYSGTNLGAPQHAYFIMGGGQYEWKVGRERLFAQALAGEGGLNRNWAANAAPGGTASFSTLVGGGVDTEVTRQFGVRVEGDIQHTNFALIQSTVDPVPYRIPGLPNYFGHILVGVVWMPRVSEGAIASTRNQPKREPVESELIFEGLSSFGHYHVFAYTWWSYLHVGGVEYDRQSWGKFIGAQLDYVAEILPVAILRQPSKTDSFGDPLTKATETVEGLGISPIGLRMMWRGGDKWKPYYLIKGGMIGFAEKALSVDGSYENFSLQQCVGIQFRLSDRLDFRAGVSDFHFSNGFIVPSNPGIDEMSYNGGLSYHLERRRNR